MIIGVTGIVYLWVYDGWQVYERSMESVWQALGNWEYISPETAPDDVRDYLAGGEKAENSVSSGNVSSGDMAENGVSGDGLDENTGVPSENGENSVPGEVKYITVGDDYFADAVFIGDSRTVGMYEYGALEETATFYASTGLTVYKLFDAPIVEVPGQKQKITVEEALSQQSFSKIYLMIGINEMGTGTVESFMEAYKEAVAHLQELQPEAVIYLQAIMKVTSQRSGQGDYITNEGIEARNEEIAKLADNTKVFYLDVNPLICDENGGLESSYTNDGVHLKAQYIPIWKEYLQTHAVEVLD